MHVLCQWFLLRDLSQGVCDSLNERRKEDAVGTVFVSFTTVNSSSYVLR